MNNAGVGGVFAPENAAVSLWPKFCFPAERSKDTVFVVSLFG